MSMQALLRELDERGVILKRVGNRLTVDAPKGTITDSLRRELAACKSNIIAMLRRENAERAAKLIQEREYVPIRSGTLGGEIVLFIRDESVEIPERWRDAVTYTLDELAEIRQAGRDALPSIHDVKHVFRGRIQTAAATYEQQEV